MTGNKVSHTVIGYMDRQWTHTHTETHICKARKKGEAREIAEKKKFRQKGNFRSFRLFRRRILFLYV